MRRLVVVGVLGLLLPLALPAVAGGSWMRSPQEEVKPGSEATFAGYTEVRVGWDQYEYMATLVGPHVGDSMGEELMVIGPVTVEPTGLGGYLGLRVSVSFVVPDDLEPGTYSVTVLGPEGQFLGDMLGGYLSVGADPDTLQNVEWALDDPLIGELPEGATLSGPGFAWPVSELRAGRYPAGAAQFMLDPSILDQPGIQLVDIPPPVEEPVPDPEPPVAEDPVSEPPIEPEAVVTPTDPVMAPMPLEDSGPMWWIAGAVGFVVALISIVAYRSRRPESIAEVETEPELTVTQV